MPLLFNAGIILKTIFFEMYHSKRNQPALKFYCYKLRHGWRALEKTVFVLEALPALCSQEKGEKSEVVRNQKVPASGSAGSKSLFAFACILPKMLQALF